MKKEEFIDFICSETGVSKKDAAAVLNTVLDGITQALVKGDGIVFTGFGAFKVIERSAREGRNPSTGEKISIPASRAVKFTPGKSLKDRIK